MHAPTLWSTLALLGLLTTLGLASARRAARVRARRAAAQPRRPGTLWTIDTKGPLLGLLVFAGLTPPETRGALVHDVGVRLEELARSCQQAVESLETAAVVRDANAGVLARGDLAFAVLLLLLPLLLIYTLTRVPHIPWVLARRIAIPLGLPRLAYHLTRLGPLPWVKDPAGGAAIAGALAVLRRPNHDPDAASWIEQRLADGKNLAAGGVIASGLLAASRGDTARARVLLDSAFEMQQRDSPAPARRVALDWLLADAAARGAWREAYARAEAHREDLSPGSYLIAGAAARVLGEPSPHDLSLRLAWLRSPRPGLARPLLERALAEPRILYASQRPAPTVTAPPPEPAPAPDPVTHALALHLHWLAADPSSLRRHPTRLVNLCAAWDAVFAADALRERVLKRAAALTVKGAPELHYDRFRGVIRVDLATLAERAELTLEALSRVEDPDSISREVAAELRRRLLEDVERCSSDLGRRVDEKRTISAIEEWSEWTALRRKYERAAALGGLEVRRLMFPKVHRDTCAHAVWLWNKRDEYAISMPVFHWLLAEAEAVGDEAAIELQRKNTNAKC